MENYSNYSSYPDSRDSSPRSREIIDCDAASWDEPAAGAGAASAPAYKAKFMCSYGGKIQPRQHDNQLAYVGGDTKILSVDRAIRLPAFLAKLASIAAAGDSTAEVCFKYQLPGEDLDALISVTNDEDLDHMMMEYDRLQRSSPSKPARLRLFLFPVNPPSPASSVSVSAAEKSDRQWFVDALNSVQIQNLEGSSPPAAAAASVQNPDFLFGFDKGYPAGNKFVDSVPPPMIPDSILAAKDVTAGSDCGSEDRHGVGEIPPAVSPAEIQRQIQELQRLHIASQEQAMMHHHRQQQQRKYEEAMNPRAFAVAGGGDYYAPQSKITEKLAPAPAQAQSPMPVQVPMHVPATYVSERHVTAGGYHMAAPQSGQEQQVYLIQTPSGGVYHQAAATAAPPPPPQQMRQVTGPVGQPYYGVHQRMVPEMYREQQMYNAAPPAMLGGDQGISIMQTQAPQRPQVGYDSAGRQVYYTTTSTFQTVPPVAVDARQGGGIGPGGVAGAVGALSQDGKVVGSNKASQASAM